MNSLKTVILVAVMTAVAYGVYATLHKKPLPPSTPAANSQWPGMPPGKAPGSPGSGSLPGTPTVSLGSPASGSSLAPAAPLGGLPSFATAGPAGPAPGTTSSDPATSSSTPATSGNPFPDPSTASSSTPATVAALPATGTLPDSRYPGLTNSSDSSTPSGASAAPSNTATPPPSADSATSSADTSTQFARTWALVQSHLSNGQLAEALLELSAWYEHPQLSPAEHAQVHDLLDRLAGTVVYSNNQHQLERPYTVQEGDTLESIGQKYQVPGALLGKINGVEPGGALRPGESLKVLHGPFDALVDMKNYRLTLFVQGHYAGKFPIGLGRDQPTQSSDCTVQSLVNDPPYRDAERFIQAGDPSNPLGKCWIDLGNYQGIHGTHDPSMIGHTGGLGCISLAPTDLDHVRDMLTVGSRVLIRK